MLMYVSARRVGMLHTRPDCPHFVNHGVVARTRLAKRAEVATLAQCGDCAQTCRPQRRSAPPIPTARRTT
jgi:transcription elongation factor Elf1